MAFHGTERRNGDRRGEEDSRKLIWWLIGSMFVVILAMAAGWAKHIDTSLDKLNVVVSLSFSDVGILKVVQADNTRRIGSIETKVDKLLNK